MSEIQKLTPEQEALIPKYIDEYLKIGLDTQPADRARAEELFKEAYKLMKLPAPKFYWEDSPFKGNKKAAQLLYSKDNPTEDEVREMTNHAQFGSFEAYWVSFYAFIGDNLPVEKDPLIDVMKELIKNVGVYWTFDEAVVATDKPVAIKLNKDGRLHNTEGMALEYKDGSGLYAIDGTIYGSLLELELERASNSKGK